jgi:O-antigen/teichoic acid export membrane protein
MTEDNFEPGTLGLVAKLRRLVLSNSMIGLADQIVVSIVNFLSMLIVARATSAQELGYYALATSIIFIAMSAQDSLVTRPYAVRVLKQVSTARTHAGSALILSFVLAVVVQFLGDIFGGLFYLGAVKFDLPPGLILAGSAVVPFMLVREFARRHSYANLDNLSALKLSLAGGIATILSYLALIHFGQMTAFAAIILQGVGALIATLLWWRKKRIHFDFNRRATFENLFDNWSLSKWFLVSQLGLQLNGYANHWITLAFLGASATGGYVAVLSIISLTNPLVFGLYNILMPKSVHTLHQDGVTALRRQVHRDVAMMAGLMAAIVLALIIFGPWLFHALYGVLDFENAIDVRQVLVVLGVSVLFSAASGVIIIGLQSAERVKRAAYLTTGIFVLGALASSLLIPHYGIMGAAYGRLIGELIGFATCWIVFHRLTEQARTPA